MPAQHRNHISQTNVKLPTISKNGLDSKRHRIFSRSQALSPNLAMKRKNVARPQKQFATPNWVHQYNTCLYKPRHAFCVSFLLILPTKTILRSR